MSTATELREKMIERLPELSGSGIAQIPNSKFWDYYNAGGKELLYDAGIVVIKDDDEKWHIKLKPETDEERRQKIVDDFLEHYHTLCDCGYDRVLEALECKNGTMQYRIRCEGWFKYEKQRGYYNTYTKRICNKWSGSDPLKHEIVEYLLETDIEVVNRKPNIDEYKELIDM